MCIRDSLPKINCNNFIRRSILKLNMADQVTACSRLIQVVPASNDADGDQPTRDHKSSKKAIWLFFRMEPNFEIFI